MRKLILVFIFLVLQVGAARCASTRCVSLSGQIEFEGVAVRVGAHDIQVLAKSGGSPEKVVTTGVAADGTYRFDKLAAGSWVLEFRVKSAKLVWDWEPGPVTVDGRHVKLPTLRPKQAAFIEGHVTDGDNGKPLAGVTVATGNPALSRAARMGRS